MAEEESAEESKTNQKQMLCQMENFKNFKIIKKANDSDFFEKAALSI